MERMVMLSSQVGWEVGTGFEWFGDEQRVF